MYDRILVPTDGSTGTAHVALHAMEIAVEHGATVHAIHVIDSGITAYLGESDAASESFDRRAQQAVRVIARMAESHGVTCETAIHKGDPAQTILDYAEEIDASLIVAGTHGRSGVRRHLIGSVSERLVRYATCPVLTVRLPETDITVDDVEHAESLIRGALEAKGYNSEKLAVERQLSVWVGRTEAESGTVVVYLDPTTQRTSVLPQ